MNIKKIRSYKKINKAGKPGTTFVYSVSGTEDELEDFKTTQGDYYREDEDGTPIWFSPKFVGERGTLIKTAKGQFKADMSAFDAANSLAEQYGGNLGNEIARVAAEQLMGVQSSKSTSSALSTPTEDKKDVDLNDL